MGLFKKILGTVQSKNMSVQYSQPTGFYIVRHEYGENQARLLFQQANDGNVDAQLSIATCFMDVAEQPYALPWYEKAAIAGNAKALHELTYFYEGRYIGVEADPVKLNKVQEMVLGLNNPDAFLKLASQYYTGDGVKKDKKKAFEYYMKAAQLGSDEGAAEVGACYLNGDGIEQNDSQAFVWLFRSKDGRYGAYNLAQCYLKGIGTEKDIEKAVVCLEKAVNCKCLELSEARKQLADLYSKGYGGTDVAMKLKKLEGDMKKNDDLIDDLVNSILEEKSNS